MVLPKMNVLGVMSGTSHDGLDLALASFWKSEKGYQYQFLSCVELSFPEGLLLRLKESRSLKGGALENLDREFGRFIGVSIVKHFDLNTIDLISSHGHTVFHQPENRITKQIGDLDEIAKATGKRVVGDFRGYDVEKGGQGAPLVPIGDALLFSEYDYCLNLGGICNYSEEIKGVRYAKDIGPCNIVGNFLASKMGFEYDKDGELSSGGESDESLLQRLNSWFYYNQTEKTSIGIEDIESSFLDLLNVELSFQDKLATYWKHVACQINEALVTPSLKVLVTGGGAKNPTLINWLKEYYYGDVIIPEEELLNFKEALIFGFLGYLRVHNIENIWASYTGAQANSIAGTVVN